MLCDEGGFNDVRSMAKVEPLGLPIPYTPTMPHSHGFVNSNIAQPVLYKASNERETGNIYRALRSISCGYR